MKSPLGSALLKAVLLNETIVLISARIPSERSTLLRENLSEDVVDGLGVGLAAGGAHDLADEKLEDAFVSRFVLGDIVGVFGDDVADRGFDGGIGDLGAEAFGGDDVRGGAAG